MPAEHIKRAVAVQDKDANSVLACARQVVGLRKAHAVLRTGSFIELDLRPPLLGFERADGSARIRCLFNLSHRPQRCRLATQGRLLFASGAIDQKVGVLDGLAACWLLL